MGASCWPPAETWSTRKQKLHLKAAACRGLRCQQCQTPRGRREEVTEAMELGAAFFFYFNLLTAALSLALSSALRTGRLEPAHLLCCPSHPVTALLGGLPRWHSGASGKTETSNAVLLLRVFLGSSWGSNVENEF